MTRASRLKEVALLFTRLGFTAFGGPAAHVAMIEDEVVNRRGWIDRRHFLDLVASVNFVPGPNSTELAIHLGLIRAGFAGLIVAGVCFITPAVLIILPLAYFYVKGGSLPRVAGAMSGINAVVIAIIIAAMIRFGRSAITDGYTATLAIVAAVAGFLLAHRPELQPELIILASAALLGAMYYGKPKPPAVSLLPLFWPEMGRLALFMLKVGATLFGSGYVLVSYLQSGLVEQHHWLSRQELLDAISIGQVTPGPLLATATFVGYLLGAQRFGGGIVGGIIGGVVATVAIFLPSFLFIAALGRVLPRIRANRYARGALSAMNAAVVALILVVTWKLGTQSLVPNGRPDAVCIFLVVAALVLILRWHINSTWLIVTGALVGIVRSAGL